MGATTITTTTTTIAAPAASRQAGARVLPPVPHITALGQRMQARADADGLPAGHELRLRAADFEWASAGYRLDVPTVGVRQFVGAWHRARRAWCEYIGEPMGD